jgi:site-specific recombinase XerD
MALVPTSSFATPALSWEDYAHSWLSQRAPSTRPVYLRVLKEFTGSLPSGTGLHDIREPHITLFISTREATLQDSTLRLKTAVLKCFFKYLKSENVIKDDPAKRLKLQKANHCFDERRLSKPEMHELIAHAAPGREQVLIRVLYRTGLRITECLSIDIDKINMEMDGGRVTVMGKGKRKRTIRLRAEDVKSLREIAGDSKGPAFRTRTGRRLSRAQAHRHVKHAATSAGIEKNVSCHWTRHAFASHLVDNGVPLKRLQDALGHASADMTNRYVHSNDRDFPGDLLD